MATKTKTELAKQLVNRYKKVELEALLSGDKPEAAPKVDRALAKQASDLAAREQALAAALEPFAIAGRDLAGQAGRQGMDEQRVTPNQAPALLAAADLWERLYGS